MAAPAAVVSHWLLGCHKLPKPLPLLFLGKWVRQKSGGQCLSFWARTPGSSLPADGAEKVTEGHKIGCVVDLVHCFLAGEGWQGGVSTSCLCTESNSNGVDKVRSAFLLETE